MTRFPVSDTGSGTLSFVLYSYEPEGREFESPRAHHSLNLNDLISVNFTLTVWRGNQKVGSSESSGRGILLSSFQSSRPHSLLRVGRLLGCIGCNNAALSRELKAFSGLAISGRQWNAGDALR